MNMLWKMSLTGIKSRLRDYLVLFSGLVMASAIFYMFESMANNEAFLENNTPIASAITIFRLGTVLLGVITFVYILYANSFLMTMRQKDYAMFMMLGAKSRKIAQMIFAETFIVGVVATLVGSVLGIGLTSVVSKLLITQLNMKITQFTPFNLNGLIITVLFFLILFLLAAIVNAFSIVNKTILVLIRADQTPSKMKQNKALFVLEVTLGIVLLACGYYVLKHVLVYREAAFGIALVTILPGTYFIFHSVIISVLSILKKSEQISLKKIYNFTLSQLSFRIREYTQMLSMVTILFALALGALTVGLGFKNEISETAESTSGYDLVMNNPRPEDQQKIERLSPILSASYTQKEDAETIYYNASEFESHPFIVIKNEDKGSRKTIKEKISAKKMNDSTVQEELRGYELPEQQKKEIRVVDKTTFDQLSLTSSTLQLVQIKNFQANLEPIQALVTKNKANNPSLQNVEYGSKQKYEIYELSNSLYSGFEFMGFFLGLAFLTMLSSCLMFKILSGSKSDVARYEMLGKIGTRRGLLKQTIRREIGVLFLAPGILGVIHVLFCLQMFNLFMQNPYENIWLPFTIFFVLYLIYYGLTTWMYTGIVLQKNKVK
jgi:putative ABC transport system permease protein